MCFGCWRFKVRRGVVVGADVAYCFLEPGSAPVSRRRSHVPLCAQCRLELFFISASIVVVFHTQKVNYAGLVQWVNPFRLQSNTGWIREWLEYRVRAAAWPALQMRSRARHEHWLHQCV
jgi:hypothetical protein